MLKVSRPEKEGVYQGSKFLKFQVLCDENELRTLFEMLPSFSIYLLTGINDGKEIAKETFLSTWGKWIDALKKGHLPTDQELKTLFASAITDDLDALWLQKVEGKGYLTKIRKPILQLQAHYFTYSPIDKIFRPMSMGQGSIFWGIQFSWPQIYQDPKTMEFFETGKVPLFEKVRSWVKEATRPTPFVVDGEKVFAPIRLGKTCFSWINNHPGLKDFKVYDA